MSVCLQKKMALILSRGPSNKAIEGEGMNLIQEEGGEGIKNSKFGLHGGRGVVSELPDLG